MRDRLIEILLEDCVTFTDEYKVSARLQAERVADILLANSVIVPPCKVGDYITRKGDAYLLLWRVDVICFYREGLPSLSATHNNVTVTMNFDGIGKVFTREEAEAALAERIEV